jgi:hypothetical protein
MQPQMQQYGKVNQQNQNQFQAQMDAEKGNQQGVQAPKQVRKKAPHEQKVIQANMSSIPSKPDIDPGYRDLTCYNCGEPGHFVGICTKAKVCFICATPGHYMTAVLFGKTHNQ